MLDGADVRSVPVVDLLRAYVPATERERADVERMLAHSASSDDPWSRHSPLHLTASAIVIDPAGGNVLLRWHERMNNWLQVGGHGDPGETAPFVIAMREAAEETGLTDLVAWPDPERPLLVHAVIVPVPAANGEPAHEHADLRFVLATREPGAARAESPTAPVRWMTPAEAIAAVGEDNVREAIDRVARLHAAHSSAPVDGPAV